MSSRFHAWWNAREKPTYVIAEAGVNHNGDPHIAERIVAAAARAGADAVKFQHFSARTLVARGAPLARCQQASDAADMASLLEPLEISFETLQRLERCCDERGVDFLVTPFGEHEASELQALGVPAVKLASPAVNDPPLLAAAVKTRLPILLSVGASTMEEIAEAVRFLDALGARERLVLLHCVSAYPAASAELRLRMIPRLSRLFGLPVGFSDHSRGDHSGAWAVALGAQIVEKHFTLDATMAGPDQKWSLEPDAFRRYVAQIRLFERALGDGEVLFSAAEQDVRALARRSVVLNREARAGDVLRPDMLALKRPGTGIAPADLPNVVGRRLIAPYPADVPLTWDVMEGAEAACTFNRLPEAVALRS